ncbi:MAG: hypothetical protein JWN35_2624 [Frankiales bacterium]|nr:hypothetical protein [Frankiales bacterium]
MARPLTRVAGAALALAGTGWLLAAPAQAASDPLSPAPAPAAVEGFSPYLPQISCDPTIKPGTDALRTLLLTTYGGRDLSTVRPCSAGTTEHQDGRAFDWGLDVTNPADKALADQFLGWLLAPGPDGVAAYNARRLGVMYVIWDSRIWGSYSAAQGWKAYTGSEPHRDHIHISLSWAGAMKQTSFWTGVAAPVDYGPCVLLAGQPAPAYSGPRTTPCPAPGPDMSLTGTPVLAQGSTGPYVFQLQALLKVAVDGAFGPVTAGALSVFQQAAGLPATGATDLSTWTVLRGGTSGAPTPAPGPTPSPVPVPVPTPVPVPVPVPKPVPKPVANPLAAYAGLTLRTGARGPAVVALQKALRLPADGAFGPRTAAAVTAFNRAHRLPADGIVRPATWTALGA